MREFLEKRRFERMDTDDTGHSYAVITYGHPDGSLSFPVVERVADGWRSGNVHYEDERVSGVFPLHLVSDPQSVTKNRDSLRRELDYWFDQHRLADLHRIAMIRRATMLTEVLAKHGLLDAAEIRDDYLEDLARHIRHEADSDTLVFFRREFASLIYRFDTAISRVPEVSEPLRSVTAAVVKEMNLLLKATDRMEMSAETARAHAEERIALMDQYSGQSAIEGGAA